MPIRILDPRIVSRIAAGEVVDRPASVVKELVENSIDAGSEQISVEVSGGGIGLIRVGDDGMGITPGDLESAFERYATSKIANLEDLESISSLGFRGEALPSIAAVSQIEIVTRVASESAGSSLELKEGVITRRGNRGRSRGTTVTVRNLLRNVPARLKFLKSSSTESGHVANVISQYALSFPEIKFTLTTDGRTTLRTPGSGRLIDSVIAVYGTEVARNMIEIGTVGTGWEDREKAVPLTSGMVSSPAITRSNRSYLSFFVNRRWVNNRLLAWSVEEAYHGLLMSGKHPLAIINIAIPPQDVDVNIHPTKSEVKFQNEGAVFSSVQKAVRQALVRQAPVPRIEDLAVKYQVTREPRQLPGLPVTTGQSAPTAPLTPSLSLPALRLLGQLANSYVVAEGPEGLFLIDQHAAHERICFEQIKQQQSRQEIDVQGLLEPATIEVNPRQDAVLQSHYQNLTEYGFSIEHFGDRTYIVRSVPALLHNKDWMAVLRELWEATPFDNTTDWMEQIAISIACHSAIRAGQSLTEDEMRQLIRQLEKASLPNTCPHGRPTMINITSKQLAREFSRK